DSTPPAALERGRDLAQPRTPNLFLSRRPHRGSPDSDLPRRFHHGERRSGRHAGCSWLSSQVRSGEPGANGSGSPCPNSSVVNSGEGNDATGSGSPRSQYANAKRAFAIARIVTMIADPRFGGTAA